MKLRRGFNTDGVVLFDASKQRFIALGEKSNEDWLIGGIGVNGE